MKAPERIWADPPSLFDGVDLWHEKQEGAELTAVEYIRKDASDAAIAAALAATPEVAALIREAEARGMERAADSLWTAEDEEDFNYWGGGSLEDAGRSALRAAQAAIRAEAAAEAQP